jgi:hypothetical protein
LWVMLDLFVDWIFPICISDSRCRLYYSYGAQECYCWFIVRCHGLVNVGFPSHIFITIPANSHCKYMHRNKKHICYLFLLFFSSIRSYVY